MNTFEKLIEARSLIDEALNTSITYDAGNTRIPAEALASKQQLLNGVECKREVLDIVNAINSLAISNSDVIHIFTRFSGHVNVFEVSANDISSVYEKGGAVNIFSESVRLDKEKAVENLLFIESQLTEFVIEAREKAEANAEVDA